MFPRLTFDATGVHIPWYFLVVGLLFLTISNGTDVAFKLRTLRALQGPKDPGQYSYVDDDYPTELPLPLRSAAMTVEWPDDELYGLWADDDWASNFPLGNGWVLFGPDEDDRSSKRKFALSMYHQLHCLDAMRYGYVGARGGMLVWPGNGTGADHHFNHCLSYLREMILCASDVTLETSVSVVNPLGNPDNGASGMGINHKCRDWTQVREYLEQNYRENQKDWNDF